MKITIPAIQIDEAEGFSPAKDIFSRKDFGERLANLIVRTNDELVIALDAEWGEGKSTFIQMWKGYVSHQRDPKIRTIYFDAFANDYQKDPFIALAAEVYELLKDDGQEKKKEFLVKAGAAAKSMARGAMKIAVRVGTGGLLDGSVVDGVEQDVSELLAEQVDSVLEERLKSSSEDKLALKNFRKYLESFASEHGGGQPIVFVIDELDRCRPDFALELIEQIKHLFSVRGITFLLVMNRKQLEESIALEMPTATVAMFSTMKYINAPNFEKFRQAWNAQYLGGFVVNNQVFDGLSGKFPIGFLIWKTDQTAAKKTPITEISVDVLDRNAQAIGEKIFCNLPNSQLLTNWIGRQKSNQTDALPLINAITPTTKTIGVRRTKWADGAIGHILIGGNDLQHAEQQTAVFSSVHSIGHAGGFFITPENLLQAVAVFSVRKLIRPTWLNDRDQFLQPTAPLTDEFKNDCLIWTLFNRGNLTAGANDLEWNGKKWALVNHFLPYTEAEVGAPDRFESDFMVQYLADKELSAEARAVLDAGRTLWQAFFAHTDVRTVRDELKLNRPDVGWYQIRNALKARNTSGDTAPVDFTSFEVAYKELSDKLRPQVFELGFLR